MSPLLVCPHCGRETDRYDQPRITVDAVVLDASGRILLIERGHPPSGWALPGGFVEPGETLEEAVARELEEETGLRVKSAIQFHTYSDPRRDPRHPTVSTVFLVEAGGILAAGDDAAAAAFFTPGNFPVPLAFDHGGILRDVLRYRRTGELPRLSPPKTGEKPS